MIGTIPKIENLDITNILDIRVATRYAPPINDLHKFLTPRVCSRTNKKSYKVGRG